MSSTPSARRLYRLSIGLGVVGAAAAAAALGAGLSVVDPALPSIDALIAACRQVIPTHLGAASALVLALVALGLAVLALALRSLRRQLFRSRRYLRALPIVGARTIAGTHVVLFAGDRPDAFCAGCLRPAVYVSTPALAALSDEELEAVVAHERHHRDRRDPLRLLLVRTLADALFFLPALRRLGERYGALAELAADAAAVRGRDAATLASALLTFGEAREPGVVVGIAPERVDHLLGAPPRWQLPVSLFAAALAAIAGIAAASVLVVTAFGGASVSAATLFAESCMLAMAALPFAAAAMLLARGVRPLAARRAGA